MVVILCWLASSLAGAYHGSVVTVLVALSVTCRNNNGDHDDHDDDDDDNDDDEDDESVSPSVTQSLSHSVAH